MSGRVNSPALKRATRRLVLPTFIWRAPARAPARDGALSGAQIAARVAQTRERDWLALQQRRGRRGFS